MSYLKIKYLLFVYENYTDKKLLENKRKLLSNYIAKVVYLYDEIRCAEVAIRTLADKMIEISPDKTVYEYLENIIKNSNVLSNTIKTIREELLIKEEVANTIMQNVINNYKNIYDEVYSISSAVREYASDEYYNRGWINDDNINKLAVEHLLIVKLLSCADIKNFVENKYGDLIKELEKDRDDEKRRKRESKSVDVSEDIKKIFGEDTAKIKPRSVNINPKSTESKEKKTLVSAPDIKESSEKLEFKYDKKIDRGDSDKGDKDKTKRSPKHVKIKRPEFSSSEEEKESTSKDINKKKALNPSESFTKTKLEKTDIEEVVTIGRDSGESEIKKVKVSRVETKGIKTEGESPSLVSQISSDIPKGTEKESTIKQEKQFEDKERNKKKNKTLVGGAESEKQDKKRRIVKGAGIEKTDFGGSFDKGGKKMIRYSNYNQSFEGDALRITNTKSDIKQGENKIAASKNIIQGVDHVTIYNELKKQFGAKEKKVSPSKKAEEPTSSPELKSGSDNKVKVDTLKETELSQETKTLSQPQDFSVLSSILKMRKPSLTDRSEDVHVPPILASYEERKKEAARKNKDKTLEKLASSRSEMIDQSSQSKSRLVGAIRSFRAITASALSSNSILGRILSFITKIIGIVPQLFTLASAFRALNASTKIGELEKDSLTRSLMYKTFGEAVSSQSAVNIKSIRGETGRENIGLYSMVAREDINKGGVNAQGGRGTVRTTVKMDSSAISDVPTPAANQPAVANIQNQDISERERAELERIKAEQSALKAELENLKKLNARYTEMSNKMERSVNDAVEKSAIQRKIAANATSNKNSDPGLDIYDRY